MLTCGLTSTKEPYGVTTTDDPHDPPGRRSPQRSRGIFAHHGAPSEAGAALLTCTFTPASGLMCPSTAEPGVIVGGPVQLGTRQPSCELLDVDGWADHAVPALHDMRRHRQPVGVVQNVLVRRGSGCRCSALADVRAGVDVVERGGLNRSSSSVMAVSTAVYAYADSLHAFSSSPKMRAKW
jgi:hypothetical protein